MSPVKRPLLLIVTGPPASGKTTLAATLASEFSIPAFHKDDFKELLARTIPGEGRSWSEQLGGAAFELLYQVSRDIIFAGGSCIVEANFNPEYGRRAFSDLAGNARLVQIVCCGDPETFYARYVERARRGQRDPVHLDLDPIRLSEVRQAVNRDYQINLPGQMIRVDTTGPVSANVPAIARQIGWRNENPGQ